MDYLSNIERYLQSTFDGYTVEEVENGYVLDFNVNGNDFTVIVPSNLNNPNVLIYGRGSDSLNQDMPALKSSLQYEDNNSIIVIPHSISYLDPKFNLVENISTVGKGVADAINYSGDIHYSGFSAGSDIGVMGMCDYINSHPGCDRQKVLLMDAKNGGSTFSSLNANQYATLKENGTLFIAFTQSKYLFNCNRVNYDKAVNNGLNILFISSVPEHGQQRDDAFGNNALGFVYGNSNALIDEDNIYTYTFFDREKREWLTITADEAYRIINKLPSDKSNLFYTNNLRTLELMDESNYKYTKNSNYTGVIKTNFEYVKTNVNLIINQIKSSNLYQMNFSPDYGSTTNNPSGYTDIVNDFRLSSLIVLEKIAIAIQNIQLACNKIENLQGQILEDVDNLSEG